MTAPKVRLLTGTSLEAAAQAAVSDVRFWEKTRAEGDCLVWIGYRDRQGYGKVGRQFVSPTPMLAHRYAWYLLHGPFGDGQIIRHTCDNPPCVRPDHLLTGTQADNIADRQARGRHRPGHLSGEAHPAHKLTAEDVLEIRRIRKDYTLSELAAIYDVSRRTIHMAATKQTWREIEDAA